MKRRVKDESGSSSTHALSVASPTNSQLQTYTGHYGMTWHGRKRDFANLPINSYDSLGRVGYIMIGEPSVATMRTITTEVVEEPPWSKLYEKQCELEVYCQWHGLRVPKARLAELPKDNIAKIFNLIEIENNQM